MKNDFFSDIIKPALSLISICMVVAAMLAGVNSLTADKIAANSASEAQQARQEVLSSASSFNEGICKLENNEYTYYTGKTENGETAGYVFTVSTLSYGGNITVTVGVGTDGTVSGVNIITISDTPGLGMKAKNDSFLQQYTGKYGDITVAKNAASAENEIVAITNATITSKAVTTCVNTALDLFETVCVKEAE